jgi:hypothetical protein
MPQISQSTFDEAVSENISTFGMSRVEAVADAVTQFESSGVDLSNLIIDAELEDVRSHPVLRSLDQINTWVLASKNISSSYSSTTETTISSIPSSDVSIPSSSSSTFTISNDFARSAPLLLSFSSLAIELNRSNDYKQICRSNNGVAILSDAIRQASKNVFAALTRQPDTDMESVLTAAFATLRSLLAGHDEARKTVQYDITTIALNCACSSPRPNSLPTLQEQNENLLISSVSALAMTPSTSTSPSPSTPPSPLYLLPAALIRSGLVTCASLCIRRETTKTQVFEFGLASHVSRHLQDSLQDATMIRDACIALCRLLTDDDMSVLASNSYAFARTIAKDHIMPRLLLQALQYHNKDASVAAEVYAALRSIIVNDEVCREVDALGGIDIISNMLALHVSQPLSAIDASSISSLSMARQPSSTLPTVSESTGSGEDIDEDAASVATSTTPHLVQAISRSVESSTIVTTILNPDSEETLVDEEPGALSESVIDTDGASSIDTSASSTTTTSKIGSRHRGLGLGIGSETSVQRRVRMVRCGFAVLRSLANSDPNKLKMGEGPTLGVLLQALENMIHSPSVIEQVVGVMSNICLRLPENSQRIVDRGGLPLLTRAMRTHMGHATLLRAVCLALRNIASKNKSLAQAALDEGFEALLQQCYMRHTSTRDVAYACLRDLGTDVETSIGQAQAERAARAISLGTVYVPA